MHKKFTEKESYVVMSEDLYDYYKDPSERDKLFESDNYLEAVSYAMEYYDKCSKGDLEYPWIESLWITPEPTGMHFDYHKYVEYALSKFTTNNN